MHRVTGSPWIADFWCWTFPEIAILGADQKERGLSELLGTRMLVKGKFGRSLSLRVRLHLEYFHLECSKRGGWGNKLHTRLYHPGRRGERNELIESFLFRNWSVSMYTSTQASNSGGYRRWAKGGWEGGREGGSSVLLALPTFPPSVISSLFT